MTAPPHMMATAAVPPSSDPTCRLLAAPLCISASSERRRALAFPGLCPGCLESVPGAGPPPASKNKPSKHWAGDQALLRELFSRNTKVKYALHTGTSTFYFTDLEICIQSPINLPSLLVGNLVDSFSEVVVVASGNQLASEILDFYFLLRKNTLVHKHPT